MFKDKVLKIVRKIPPGSFLTYKKVARLAGNEKAFRVVAYLMAHNKDKSLPCHRVIKNDLIVGGYKGKQNLDWLKAAYLLKEGAVGVIPTDTIYSLCTSAFQKKSVEKIFWLKKRQITKPFIILITNVDELKLFNINLSKWQRKIIKYVWPGKISVVFSCRSKKFFYLHRGTETIAFRLPQNKFIRRILKISGPLVAPSANWQDYPPAQSISQAKKYFGSQVFYLNRGKINGQPSTLIDLTSQKIKVLRKGADFSKIVFLFKII